VEEFFPILLFIAWLALGIIGSANRRKRRQGKPPQPARGRTRAPAAPAPKRESVFERFRRELEQLQAEMERAQAEQATTGGTTGPMGRRAGVRLPEAEDVEDGESLETAVEVVSLEQPPPARLRHVVDLDDAADEVVRRRLREAEARNRALSPEDHRKFDERIRRKAPLVPEAPRLVRRAAIPLRQAVMWREILGPPVALSGGDPADRPG